MGVEHVKLLLTRSQQQQRFGVEQTAALASGASNDLPVLPWAAQVSKSSRGHWHVKTGAG